LADTRAYSSRVRRFLFGLGLAALVFGSRRARADVFDMPPGQTSLSLVPVGNPSNPDDVPYGQGFRYGRVNYGYNIGKFEITIGQYTEFLNAVAASRHLWPLFNEHGNRS
jgi:hypothetical protein